VSTVASTESGTRPAPPPASLVTSISGRRVATDRIVTVLVWVAFFLAVVPLVWILWTVLSRGFSVVSDSEWWTHSQAGISPRREGGGAYHAIVGTVLIALVTAIIAVPIAIFTAIYLVEYGHGRFARVVSFMVDILTGIPSIVAALFIYAVWIGVFKQQRVGFAVSLALVLLMIPVVVRSTEEMLKLVPNELREASYALGVPKWKTISRIVLPTAASGIITGVLLGLARVMGETAPLIILAPYTAFINGNLFSGNMAALPTLIYTNFGNNVQPQLDRMWGAALTLILLVLVLNIAGRLVARFGAVSGRPRSTT
jgi:phosphate transport system permease protein